MTQPLPLIMFGAAGRMGRMILSLAAAQPAEFSILAAIDRPDHPEAGRPLGELIGGAPAGIQLGATPPPAAPGAVAIDFSLPEASLANLAWCRGAGCPVLIGTTGFSAAQRAEIEAAAADVAVLLTPNTSLGVNVLFYLASRAAAMLGPDYDVEITEMHHRHKQDAPSGTARRLAEVILEARDGDYGRDMRHGREGIVGERTRGEIGMHALRGGDVVGEHAVILAGPHERIELTHRAHSRELFAAGALRAARWLAGRGPGFYTMSDMLGL